MKEKRKVSSNLGRTQYSRADELYSNIKKKMGATISCPFYGGKKYPQFNNKTHDILNPDFPNPMVPVEQFDFCKHKDEWGLQAYCKICYKAYRDARIKAARTTWTSMNDNQIREWYLQNVGLTMRCSVCKKDLSPKHFSISRSMEKGLHNECFNCQMAKSGSVREQEWLSDGDWSSWKKVVVKLRKSKTVKCAGWSRSVASRACLGYDVGKRMHADHIIPLRAGGINDEKNFQPLCSSCNSKKSDQIDPAFSATKIKMLVGKGYKEIINGEDSVSTIERKLKTALVKRIEDLIDNKGYLEAIKAKKKEVNGQWDINRAYRKGSEWISQIRKGVED